MPELEMDIRKVEDMESELKNIVEKTIHSRVNLSDDLKNRFCSMLSAQRAFLQLAFSRSDSCASDSGVHVESDGGPVIAEEDQETSRKTNSVKRKLSSNISENCITLKRLGDCISRFEKLDSYHTIVHPALKKKKTRSCQTD